jgi:type II secretory pathway predicted ATPase ExeA
MYEVFYGFREKPFSLLPDPGFLYPSEQHRLALDLLEYGLTNQASFVVVTGGIGTGKTTLIRQLLNHVDRDVTVGLISNTHPSFGDLLQWVLLAFNLDGAGKDKAGMYRVLTDFLIEEYRQGRRTVLIIDEAQNLSPETLEELRMLSNINADKHLVLQIFLVGQAGLRDMLRRPDLIQFAQRIAVDYHLEALSLEETTAYVSHRLHIAGGNPNLFDAPACAAIYRASGGVPRLINLLCDTALVYGYAMSADRIGGELVEEVIQAKQRSGIFPIPSQCQTGQSENESITGTIIEDDAEEETQAKTLRVAVVSDTESQRDYLKSVLDQCGMEVVAAMTVASEPITLASLNRPDILIVDLDHDVERDLRHLAALLEQSAGPVLFNDSSDARTDNSNSDASLRKRLSLKLAALSR